MQVSTPSLDQSEKPPSSSLRLTTCRGDAPTHRARWRPLLIGWCTWCGSREASSAHSLSVEEGICLPLASVTGILAKF